MVAPMPRVRFSRVIGQWRGRQHKFRDDRLVVSVKKGVSESVLDEVPHFIAAGLQSHIDVTQIEVTHHAGRPWSIFKFPPIQDAATLLPQIAAQIAADDRILYAEPAFIGHAALEPSSAETEWGEQHWAEWIGLPGAWDITKGDAGVLIVLVDSGISIDVGSGETDPDHPDLLGPRYLTRTGVNQDYVDDDDVPEDDYPEGHGTAVAGIATAAGDNGTGMAGVNWVSNVYIARVLRPDDDWDTGSLKDAVHNALTYAAGAKIERVVINVSLYTDADVDQMRQMLDESPTLVPKVLFCCSVKVMGLSRTEIMWPAAYASEYDFVLPVASTNGGDDAAADFIAEPLGLYNYDAVGIFAPGVAIHTTRPTYTRGASGVATEVNYGDSTGTSFATPMVTGVASLMWGLNKELTAKQLIECMKNMADVLYYTKKDDTGAIISTAAPHYRLNASKAVEAAKWNIQLKESHLVFTEVAVGDHYDKKVVFETDCVHELNFEMVAGSDSGFPASGSLTVDPASGRYDPSTLTGLFDKIVVTYTPPAAGDISYGEFRIKCKETAQEWTVFITASAAVDEGTGVVLVADRSGSMAEDSGITWGTEALSRMAVLFESAGILVDTLRIGDGLGVVGFSSDVDVPLSYDDIIETTNRDAIKADIATMSPGGATSIGGGLVKALAVFAGASQTQRALIVLTDGQENTEPYVADVLGSVSVRTYAIGMGTAEVLQPAPLETLTAATGGCLVLTDALDDRARYRVAKYVLQMLAEVDGSSMVLDPAGILRPRQQLSIPFDLCSDDRECEVILMTPMPRLVRMSIVAPDGKELSADAGGLRRVVGSSVISNRFTLPMARSHGGKWNAVISIADETAESKLREHSVAREVRVPSVPYHLIVISRSNIRMEARACSTSSQPGATVVLRTVVTRSGLPLDSHVRVTAVVRRRDQDFARVALDPIGQGVYQGSFVTSQTGVYECLIRATGLIENGERFTREQTVTAHTWHAGAMPSDLNHARMRERDRGKDD